MNLDTTHSLIVLLGTLLAGGVGVHLVANVLKKLFKLNSSSVIHTMVVALAVVASGLQYVMQIHSKLPPEILGVSATAIYGFSQIIYRYTSYTTDFLGKVRAYNESIKPADTTTETTVVAPTTDTAQPSAASF